jgi:large subunit ribosomal protein L3
MITAFLAKKLKQTQLFDASGRRHAVTILEAGPCPVLQIKTPEKDGYTAVQIGMGIRNNPRQPQQGHAKHARLTKTPRFLREIREEAGDLTVGTTITVDQIFQAGDMIAVTGVSKGKGFAGVVKRHHFAGGPATHGQSDRERAPGSIGGTTTPGRVYKGKRMAGRMGGEMVTVKGLKVVSVDIAKNQLIVSGLIPGAANGLMFVKRINKREEQPAQVEAKS